MNDQDRVNQQHLFELPSILGTQYLGAAGMSEDAVNTAVRHDPTIERLVEEAEAVLNNPELTSIERHVLATARVGRRILKGSTGSAARLVRCQLNVLQSRPF